MKRYACGVLGAMFDARLIAGFCGVFLSVGMHELFHIILHFGEIESIHIFPDAYAIVEVIFVPTANYNLAIEEAIAYGITIITLLLTAMLIADINDAHEKKSVYQSIIPKNLDLYPSVQDEQDTVEHIASLLGLASSRVS